MRSRTTTYGPGGWKPALPDENILALDDVTEPGLNADRRTIPADGATPAVLHFASATDAGPHRWLVNGAEHLEAAEQDAASGLYWSELEVTRDAADVIEVTVGGETLTIEAV